MFGEEPIVGNAYHKIDSKRRIFIPAFANPETKEKLILKLVEMDGIPAIKIFSSIELENTINELRELQSRVTSQEEYFKITTTIETICMELAARVKVDDQHRVTFPEIAMEHLELESNDQIHFIGAGKTLLARKRAKK